MKRKIIGKILVKLARVTRQGGFSTMQVIAALAIAGVITAGAAAVMIPAYNQQVLNSAFEELTTIANATRQVREYNGLYSLGATPGIIDVAELVTNGYLSDQLYSDGVKENRLGNDFTIVSAGTFRAATLAYTFDSNNQCLVIAPRAARGVGGLSVAADGVAPFVVTGTTIAGLCSNGVLTLFIAL